ncbi:MAG: hypothetical protein HY269_09425, partial [Deltaproteobacteria bacterium]|nr:hypothetical protein [Deltaproteobacteria bacterium]
AGGVGEDQPNAWRDVLKVQKGLANTDHYAFDMAKERSGEHSPDLAQAIRKFQREKQEEIDGIVLSGGPTIARMKEELFGDNALRIRKSPTSEPDEGAVTPVRLPPASEPEPDGPPVAPVQYRGQESGGSRPGPTPEFPVLPRGRYPRDPHGLDDPNHPYDPAKPVPPSKTVELTEKDVELIARLIKHEAGVHDELGRQGVLFNVLNRMAVGDYFGRPEQGASRAVAVMNKRGAYQAVRDHGRGNVANLRVDPQELIERVAEVKQWISEIKNGELTDPTDGNLYFLNREESRKHGWTERGRRVTGDFGADVEPLMVFGRAGEVHHFYNRYRGRAKEFVPPIESITHLRK